MALDIDKRFFLIESVVAKRDRVRAGVEQVFQDGFGDAKAAGRVLAIHDDEVELIAFAEFGQRVEDGPAPSTADDVTEKK